ncbi:transposable element Tcb1 transposase [Trichonephila clavipes]|uniref:Transposable element Tcb1 transposase n=1 Tax=Trichonephila clavipes TaxID=2585209 RepID=A0A8X6RW15_TRICX|nr:transposable element Tcb1 transposase [Trichonephila clavipes]
MSKPNRQARVAFAKMYVRQPTESWENVIFVDESRYNIFGSDGKETVWFKSNTAIHVNNLRPTVKFGATDLIAWGFMASSGVAAIRDISRSHLDPNDFTVLNCIVKGHAFLSPPSLRLRLCSRFTLLAT